MSSTADSDSTPRPARSGRKRRLGIAVLGTLAALGAGAVAAARYGLVERFRRRKEGHAAPDLTGDAHPDGTSRAPDHFRPDGDAPVPKSDRDALRPATVPAPRSTDAVEEPTVH
ncbi:hypothetical protein GCM10023219_31350 [Stakelama sediminis]|uniref:Uncharacterized protein n=1 Tax=Stakelama sediminis TaxID=463200 RepID=A0A840Z1R0_9SPHN|nr:hypothetical protein [Stakelama sediminis]MBB5719674.1 hypothetical protein [Stakelama sediminis]